VGNQVADFSLPDPAGKNVNFSDFKGKYVLVDFWASWCVPCRQSFPHMREMYKKYKSSQFEIYNISIDEDKAAWLKAVKEEKNPWPQSLDNQNINQKGFAVTGVPASFLIDPQGKIIAREVGFEPGGDGVIEKKLKEIFPAAGDGQPKSIPMVEMN
jgi:thiol-disulfide isomerase/thioredoxin